MKKISKVIQVVVVAGIVIFLGINTCFRVITVDENKEITGERGVLEEAIRPGKINYAYYYQYAMESGNIAVKIIDDYGISALIEKPELDSLRQVVQRMSDSAYSNSSKIPFQVLQRSNGELATMYTDYFIRAMDLFSSGFANKDIKTARAGNTKYIAYTEWARTKKEADFKKME